MRSCDALPRRLACLILLAAAGLCGCSKEIPIVQYPAFWRPELKSIAVTPFRCASGQEEAGNVLADKLAAALVANGTYRVFNRNELKTILDERDLQIAFGQDSEAAAKQFQKLG